MKWICLYIWTVRFDSCPFEKVVYADTAKEACEVAIAQEKYCEIAAKRMAQEVLL